MIKKCLMIVCMLGFAVTAGACSSMKPAPTTVSKTVDAEKKIEMDRRAKK